MQLLKFLFAAMAISATALPMKSSEVQALEKLKHEVAAEGWYPSKEKAVAGGCRWFGSHAHKFCDKCATSTRGCDFVIQKLHKCYGCWKCPACKTE